MNMFDMVGKSHKPNTYRKLERLNESLRHEEPDRVPINDFFSVGFIRRWREELKLPDDSCDRRRCFCADDNQIAGEGDGFILGNESDPLRARLGSHYRHKSGRALNALTARKPQVSPSRAGSFISMKFKYIRESDRA